MHKGLRDKIKHQISLDAIQEIKAINSHFQELANVRCKLGEITPKHLNAWQDTLDENTFRTEINFPLIKAGWTPLHAASANARPHCVRLLLAAGSDPNVRDFGGRSALDVAGFACYNGRQINPNNFAEVIKLLLKANPGNRSINQLKISHTPLHTAVEVGSIEGIAELLAVGASVSCLNQDGLTPLHLCVKKKQKDHLQIFLNKDVENASVVDKDGQTILHTAVRAKWVPGVCIALAAGAHPLAVAQYGETPFHLAAALGNVDIFSEIIEANGVRENINFKNAVHKTALFKAVEKGHTECVRKLLKYGASISETASQKMNVIHVAAKLGHADVLKLLLERSYTVTTDIINSRTAHDGKGFGPIHFAVWNNHPECVKLLLSKNACLILKTLCGPDKLSTPLHIAAMKNNLEIAKILLKFSTAIVHEVNNLGWTPLHTASHYKSRDVIFFLLKEGANLATITRGQTMLRKTAMEMIMNNLSKPTEFMEEVFDSCIHDNDLNLHEPQYQVTVDYSILITDTKDALSKTLPDYTLPINHNMGQMTVVDAIIGSGNRQKQNRLLLHPLIESFLCLKWRALLPFFCMIIIVYIAFVIALTGFVLSTFYDTDTEKSIPYTYDSGPWASITFAALSILVVQELFYYKFSRRYFGQFETWILLTFGFLIIGFSLGFMIEFHAEGPFENPFAALVKTMVMMASEFDYDDLIDNIKEKKGLAPSLIPVRIIFLGFLIFTAIVLMNLMVGVAVNDLQNLEFLGNIRKTEKQVEFLAFLENIRKYLRLHRLLPACILKKFIVEKKITLCPSERSCKYYRKLPRHIRESIFEIAQEQKRHTDVEHDTKTYNTKLNEIYKAIVKRSKEEELSNTKVLIEEQQNGKQDMELIVAELKKQLDLHFERTIELFNIKTDSILNKLKGVGNEGIIEV
ncbi:transient receptor potential channel pyrexia isoform X2 [Manduca sexta]|uniref:transient receptor potential channel pyrexia isoform X2 n=1 Tax=Manduca sexta TaxID=7130 RepID=UPI00188FAD2D|nr:transient receptor potential channel pyrexia isoform X2 [Manduca sexta]